MTAALQTPDEPAGGNRNRKHWPSLLQCWNESEIFFIKAVAGRESHELGSNC
jgi:hypothetical protein